MMIRHYIALFWDQVQKDMIKIFKKQTSSDKKPNKKLKKLVKKRKEKLLRNS